MIHQQTGILNISAGLDRRLSRRPTLLLFPLFRYTRIQRTRKFR